MLLTYNLNVIDVGLKLGNDALSFYYRGLYIFFNTNFPIKEYNK